MELEQDLGELDDSESSSLPLEERKVFTQPLDLSVQTLVEQWTLDVLVLPEIQRQYVWDDGKASRLVESLLLKIPIPVLYFAETEEAKFEIIDGHQRVRSIERYISNEFALSELPFLQLPIRLVARIDVGKGDGFRFHGKGQFERKVALLVADHTAVNPARKQAARQAELFKKLDLFRLGGEPVHTRMFQHKIQRQKPPHDD